MLEKNEILLVIFILLIIFYLVISFGARNSKKKTISPEIKSYILSVRILIGMIAVVALILWSFI